MSPGVISRINGAFGVAYVGIDHQIYFTWPSGRREWTVERIGGGGLTDNPVAIAYYQGNPVVAHLGRDRSYWWSQRIQDPQGQWRQWQRVPSTALPEPLNRFTPAALGATGTGFTLAAVGANSGRIVVTRFDGGVGGHWRSLDRESTGRRILAGAGPVIYTLYNAGRAYLAYLAITGTDDHVYQKALGG
jgi:hypothetical protein